MNLVPRSLRGFLSLVASGGLLCLAMAGQAQQVTITPETPEAYQPFTLQVPILCASGNPIDLVLQISSESIAFVVPDWGCFPEAPPVEKIAHIGGLPGGTYSILRKLHEDDDVGDNPFPDVEGIVQVAPAPPTQPVFAFYNGDIGHYFITAGTAERDSLLGGGGGGGWGIVDEGFNAWPAAGPAPTAAKPVCRFYSAAVNSHFYTAGPNECELLKQPGSGWTYEGIAFRALVPTKGSCYPGTTPVWRLYNDRFAQADSNHRFVASADTYRHMMANGWIGEGVAFCSPES